MKFSSVDVNGDIAQLSSNLDGQIVLAGGSYITPYAIQMAKFAAKLLSDYQKTSNPAYKEIIKNAFNNIAMNELVRIKVTTTSVATRAFVSNVLKGLARIVPAIFNGPLMLFILPCPVDDFLNGGCMDTHNPTLI